MSTYSGGESVTPSKEIAQCKGCSWKGKSLRGHLVRSKFGCKDLYDMQGLAVEAQRVQDLQKAKWESDHRGERSERMSQQRRTPKKELPLKRTASSSPSLASPRKQADSAANRETLSCPRDDVDHRPSKVIAQCTGCSWNGNSLRGHLVRSKSGCKDLYDMHELEVEAQRIQDLQKAKWEADHREERSKRMGQQRHTPKKESPLKRTSSSSPSLASPRKQPNLAPRENDEESMKGPPVVYEGKCRNCDYSKKSLRKHLAQSSNNCSNFYTKEELFALENHASLVHRDKISNWMKAKREIPKEVCNICDKKFVDNHLLNRHISEAHNSEAFLCQQCPKSFRRREYLRDHLHTVHGVRELFSNSTVCSQCNMEFTLLQNLNRHILEVHNDSAPFYCTTCKFSLARKEHLDRHILMCMNKLQIITWRCKLCPRENKDSKKLIRGKFSRWENYKKHIDEVHFKEKDWHCDQCTQKFARWANLNRHISIEHDEEIMFSCPVCSRNFNWIEKLNRHMKDVHKEESKFECDGCSKNFSRWENLRRHQESNNCIIHYECQFCHDENLYFKSKKEAREHFLWIPRGSSNDKRPDAVYSCVTSKKEAKKRENEKWRKTSSMRAIREIEMVKQSKPETPELAKGWFCTFCDPEPEFVTSQELLKHIDVVHPEIEALF